MAIMYSYPLNDDIKSSDELVGTTEKNINGKSKTVTRNFLLSDLAEFFIIDGGIQKTITLTTNNTSGPATLNQETGVLNIPQYSGGGQVTPYALTKVDDTNITLTLTGSPLTSLLQPVTMTLGWTGTLADSRISSASTWNAKQNALNGTGFVKSTSGTISYDNNTYYLASNPSGFTNNLGTITSITASSPLTGGVIDSSGTIGITQAGSTSNGYLTSTDWTIFNNKENSVNKQNSLLVDGTGVKFPTVDAVNAGILNSQYWTKTGDDIQNNNIGNTQVKILTGKQFQLLNSANTVVGYIDETGIGKFGAGSTYTSFGPATANIHLYMVRTQMSANFTLGNPQISQPYSLISTNYFGTSYVAGSAEDSASAVAEHSFNIGNSVGNGITSGIFRISRTRLQSTVPVKYATDLSLSYDDRTLVDKGYVTIGLSTKENLLGNPLVNGYVLSSTTSGTRSWIPMSGGGGGGDMYKAVYDTNNDGIVDSAQAMVTLGRNMTGSTLYKGTIVYISGATGQLPNFVKSIASGEGTSAGTFGVVNADILSSSNGWVTTIGLLEGLDTRTTATNPFTDVTLNIGDTVYLHPTIAGYITNIKPSAPNHLVYIGKVINVGPSTQGAILYRIQNGYELDELHNVQAQSPSNKDTLYYDSASTQWKTSSIPTILGYTPANKAGDTFTGSISASNLSGTNTGDQTLQSVTNLGNTTTNRLDINVSGNTSYAALDITADNIAARIFSYSGKALEVVGGMEVMIWPGSNDDFVRFTDDAVEKAKIDHTGKYFGSGFVKNGGSATQLLAADGSSVTAGSNITISGGTIQSIPVSPQQGAYTVLANNTSNTTTPTQRTFKNFNQTYYTGTIQWVGIAAPSGTTKHTYSWSQVGNLVTLTLNLSYDIQGLNLETVFCSIPVDMPQPTRPISVKNINDVVCYSPGVLSSTRQSYSPNATFASIRLKTEGDPPNGIPDVFDIAIARDPGPYQYAYATIQYFTPI